MSIMNEVNEVLGQYVRMHGFPSSIWQLHYVAVKAAEILNRYDPYWVVSADIVEDPNGGPDYVAIRWDPPKGFGGGHIEEAASLQELYNIAKEEAVASLFTCDNCGIVEPTLINERRVCSVCLEGAD